MTDGTGWVDVAGGRLPYEVAGSGSGVVLAHAGIADMRQWDPQWAALTARHRVVRYDLRGFGRADVADVRFSNRADLVAVMDAAGLDRAVLVGCSRAGSIVIDTALEYPDRVSGLVWVCGGISGADGENTAVEQAEFEKGEALEEAKDWAAAAEHDVEIWVDGFGQAPGRAPAAARDAVRTMAYETYVQEKPYGDTIVLDPPAIGRLGEITGADPRDRRGARRVGHGRERGRARGVRPRRAADRPAGRRAHAQPRAPRLVQRDAAGVPRDRPVVAAGPRRLPGTLSATRRQCPVGQLARLAFAVADSTQGAVHADIRPDLPSAATTGPDDRLRLALRVLR